MKLFSIFLGASRVEFSVEAQNGKYVGMVNQTIIAEGADFDSVREAVLNVIENGPMPKELH